MKKQKKLLDRRSTTRMSVQLYVVKYIDNTTRQNYWKLFTVVRLSNRLKVETNQTNIDILPAQSTTAIHERPGERGSYFFFMLLGYTFFKLVDY